MGRHLVASEPCTVLGRASEAVLGKQGWKEQLGRELDCLVGV